MDSLFTPNVTSERDEEHRLRMAAEARIKELEDNAVKSEEAHKEELAKFSELHDMAEKAKANEIDMMSIVRVIQNRIFNHNSDRMRFLNSQLDIDDETVKEQGFEAMLESMKCHFPQSTLNKYIPPAKKQGKKIA